MCSRGLGRGRGRGCRVGGSGYWDGIGLLRDLLYCDIGRRGFDLLGLRSVFSDLRVSCDEY